MNLNELIDDEVENEVKKLPNIESDDDPDYKNFEELNELIFSPQIESLNDQIQTLEHLKEIKDYLDKKKKIDRKLSVKINEIDNSFYNKRLSRESFTEEPTKTNYQDTIVFLDDRINDVQNNSLTILKEVLSQGLEQCETLYKKFTDEIQPEVLKYYNDVCELITDNENILSTESILFFNPDKKSFYDAYHKYLKDILKDEFYTIEDSINPIRAESFKETVRKIDDLLENNPLFNKFIKIMVDHEKPVPIKDILLSEVMQCDITIDDIFLIFRGTKGHWYFSNMEYIIDYVINIIEFKSNDIKEMDDSNQIAQYMINMKEELYEIKLGLDFIICFIRNIFPFMRLCRALFLQIGI
mgnify:CR=1 FL=1